MYTAIRNLNIQRWITVLSVILFVLKVWAYLKTKSVLVLSDALESIVNIVAGFIGLYSLYIASKPKDKNHPYGHGKAEFVSAAIEGTLIIVAAAFIFYEAILHLILPAPLLQIDQGIWIISLTAIVNFFAGYICIINGKKNNSLALIASGKHLQTDTFSTIAVVIGLWLVHQTNLIWIDSAIALGMSFFIAWSGYQILKGSLAGIMDEADKALLNTLIQTIQQQRQPNWIDLHNLRIIKYGSKLHVDCHLTVPWYLTVHAAHIEIDSLHQIIQKKFGESIELFVHTDACLPLSCSICNLIACPERKHSFKQTLEWNLDNVLANTKHQL